MPARPDLAARARIDAHPGLAFKLREIAGEQAAHLINLICWGELLFASDQRFEQAKPDRAESAARVVRAARELAAALEETTWPGVGDHEVKASPRLGNGYNGDPVPLVAYLRRLADHTAELAANGPDFKDRYPLGQSKTTRRAFMLRHIKQTINDLLRDQRFERAKLAAEIATAVLDETITEEDIAKL